VSHEADALGLPPGILAHHFSSLGGRTRRCGWNVVFLATESCSSPACSPATRLPFQFPEAFANAAVTWS